MKDDPAELPGSPAIVPATSAPQPALTTAAGRLRLSPGCPPPCSGGRGNRYFAVVKAVGADRKVLAKAKIKLGRY